MDLITVGISDCRISATPGEVLVTHSLGSCLAVAIHDPVAKVGGLLHFLLPSSQLDLMKALNNPFVYADTGIPELFHRAYAAGASKARLDVAVVGGAQVMDHGGVFNIGKKNILACKKILWSAGVTIRAEETGGTQSRTVRLTVGPGTITWANASRVRRDLLVAKGVE